VKSWSNFGHDHLFTDVLPPGPDQHEAERNLDVLRYLCGTAEAPVAELWLRPQDILAAKTFMVENGLSESKPIVAFGVGAAKEWSRWPFYGDLIKHLLTEWDFTPLIVAGPGEEALVRQLLLQVPEAVVTSLPLGAIPALFSQCTLFVGNNSGPIHLAAGIGLPLVEISSHPYNAPRGHENDPNRFGALAAQKILIRPKRFIEDCTGGCMKEIPHCITTITPQEVAAEVLQLADSLASRVMA
jgi:ADP-heptose:LPS heptosyltransferase